MWEGSSNMVTLGRIALAPSTRCTITRRNVVRNPNHPSYPEYGERGMEFRFLDFQHFFDTLGPRPSPTHSLDRFPNNDGHYEPGNVRWATY